MKIYLILTIALCFLGSNAFASSAKGINIDLNTYYYKSQVNSAESTTVKQDLKVGFITANSLYFGGISMMSGESFLSSTYSSGLGASAGINFKTNFYFHVHLILTAKTQSYSSGSGYQWDLGYSSNVNQNVNVGVLLVQKSLTYTKNSSGNTLSSNVNYVDTFPMLSVGFTM